MVFNYESITFSTNFSSKISISCKSPRKAGSSTAPVRHLQAPRSARSTNEGREQKVVTELTVPENKDKFDYATRPAEQISKQISKDAGVTPSNSSDVSQEPQPFDSIREKFGLTDKS